MVSKTHIIKTTEYGAVIQDNRTVADSLRGRTSSRKIGERTDSTNKGSVRWIAVQEG